MSEKLKQPNQHEARTPTEEELKLGFVLAPDETVKFDISPKGERTTREYNWGGDRIYGQLMAQVRIGGDNEHTTGFVMNAFDHALTQNQQKLILYPTTVGRAVTIDLKAGQMQGIGRNYEGQEMLPGTISRDHCAVGLDEESHLVIENHNPTNETAVQKIG